MSHCRKVVRRFSALLCLSRRQHYLRKDQLSGGHPLMYASAHQRRPTSLPPSSSPPMLALRLWQPRLAATWKSIPPTRSYSSIAISRPLSLPFRTSSFVSLFSPGSVSTHASLNDVTKHTSLTRDNKAQEQTLSDDDEVELTGHEESECDLSDYLTLTSQWSDGDEQAEWWQLPPSRMESDSPTSSSLTTVTPLKTASQLSTTRGATEEVGVEFEADVEPGEEEGGGKGNLDMVRRLQEGKYRTLCNLIDSANHPLPLARLLPSWFKRLRRRLRYLFSSCYCCNRCT